MAQQAACAGGDGGRHGAGVRRAQCGRAVQQRGHGQLCGGARSVRATLPRRACGTHRVHARDRAGRACPTGLQCPPARCPSWTAGWPESWCVAAPHLATGRRSRATRSCKATVELPQPLFPWRLSPAPDGRMLALVGSDAGVRLWDMRACVLRPPMRVRVGRRLMRPGRCRLDAGPLAAFHGRQPGLVMRAAAVQFAGDPGTLLVCTCMHMRACAQVYMHVTHALTHRRAMASRWCALCARTRWGWPRTPAIPVWSCTSG